VLPLGSWTRDNLHCSIGRCEVSYEIDVSEPGTLLVDVYAPVGPGFPDCELSLEREAGEPVDARTDQAKTRRRLRVASADPGTYRLRVTAKGETDELFDFEVVASVEGGAPEASPSAAKPVPPKPSAARPAPAARPKPSSSSKTPELPITPEPPRRPEPLPPGEPASPEAPSAPLAAEPAAPRPEWVIAEVLDVEEVAGRPAAVMLEAGGSEGIEPGMRGELFEGDAVIGRIEVVEVYPTGSRARILGALSGPVNFDTLSRIQKSENAPSTTGK
jgi:hypothetical protein